VSGRFQEWQEGDKERRDELFGIRTERMLRVGDHLWEQNANGEIRELEGIVARRQITEDFIDSGLFARHPQYVHYVDRETLPDGRTIYQLRVAPPDGETYEVGIDANTWLIDEKAYADHDSLQIAIFSDYHVIDGFLIPFTEVDSDGDHAFDITSRVTSVSVDQPISPAIFDPFTPEVVENTAPVTIPFQERGGLIYTQVTIANKPYTFLIDSASQGDVFDPMLAAALGLHPEGSVEIRGAGRTTSPGVIETPPISLGGVVFPMHIATVVDMPSLLAMHVDGILGYPFFAAAELRFDPTRQTLTIAPPKSLPRDGTRIDVDTDRELPEVEGQLDNVPARLIIDTGDANELLVFKSFIDAHPGVIQLANFGPVSNSGIGGSVNAVGTIVDVLQLGPYRLFNRYADVVLGTTGAFADRNDGGNVGFGSLRNFVLTFDLSDHALYLQPAAGFNDGHARRVPD